MAWEEGCDDDDDDDGVGEVACCPNCQIYDQCRYVEVRVEDLKRSDVKALTALWKAIGKVLSSKVKERWIRNEMLKGQPKGVTPT